MSNTIAWLNHESQFNQISASTKIINDLPKSIYLIRFNPLTEELYLEKNSDKFEFNFKIYGKETKLINHILHTFKNTSSNLGVLFNGTKGTGKTVTAKLIANSMDLPIILCDRPYKNLVNFISKINCDCILFFDEFEKNFKADEEDAGLLSLMDGVFNSPYRRIFLMTTNNLYINSNLLSRPSRIRYTKHFGNLDIEVVKEYLEDNLINKDYQKEIIEYIDTLSISTIDILKSIVEEINIHDVHIDEFKSFFNVQTAKYSWEVLYKVVENPSYNISNFRKELSLVGTFNEDGNEICYSDYDIYTRRVNSELHVANLQIRDEFFGGKVTATLSSDNIITVVDNYGTTYFVKILNVENKPSLYGASLVL